MKRLLKVLTFSLPLVLFGFVGKVSAQPIFKLEGLAKETAIEPQIFLILQYLLGSAFFLGVFALVIGGFYYITSAGDEARAERAKTILTYSIVGLVVILLSMTIILTLNNVLVTR